MKIWNVPIEKLEERYSFQWYYWFIKEFMKHDLTFETIYPEPLTDAITKGSFLDIAGTHFFKAQQLSILSRKFFESEVHDGDIIFLHDCWWPGIEALAYMRQGLGIDVKIVGCVFAGTWDNYDFTFKKGMSYWGEELENSWFKILDKIFVATEFHKRLILERRKIDPKKLVVTGHPMYPEFDKITERKENIIVFPHRLDSEKNPQLFDLLEKELKEDFPYFWKCLKTIEVTKTKKEFYDLLQRAKIAVSFADQETFGFSMIEAVFADCFPVVPNRLAYKELYTECFKYDSIHEVPLIVENIMKYPRIFEEARINNKKKLIEIGTTAIDKMIYEMEKF